MEDFWSREEIRAAVQRLREAAGDTEISMEALDKCFLETLRLCEGASFYTVKNLEFTYKIKGREMFVDRKNKSITRSTALLAFHIALEIQRRGEKVTGPKKLGTFGASYLYPIFLKLGLLSLF